MAKYTCCECGKTFEDDSPEAELEIEYYGKVRCFTCEINFLMNILGVEPAYKRDMHGIEVTYSRKKLRVGEKDGSGSST